MADYRHTQPGYLVLAALGWGLVITLVLLFLVETAAERGIIGSVAALILFALFVFGKLSVAVNDEEIRVWFGFGLIRKKIPAGEITMAQVVRNPWYFGWGIRIIPGGWMYNVSGLDAVELAFRNGRVFRIGTDDAENLARAIRRVGSDGTD